MTAAATLLTEDQQEKWANGWMNYVAEGKAPNAKLESVFKRFKKWLADLWANMTGRKDKVELTEGIRQVFDWLLTGDAAFDVRYDLDNALVSQLVVTQLRNNKNRRQLIVITHNANIVVNGDAELVMPMEFVGGQIVNNTAGGLQERSVRK